MMEMVRRPAFLWLLAACALAWNVGRAAHGSLIWPMINDPPIFHYIVTRILAGEIPYRDIFDMNMPLTYLLHFLCLKLFGAGDLALRWFDLTWLAATGFVMALFCWRRSRLCGLLAALLFAGLHISGGAYAAAQRDYFMVVFLVAAAHGAARSVSAEHAASWWRVSGFCLGLAFLIKPYAALYAPMVWLILFCHPQLSVERDRILWHLLLGFAIPLVIAMLWLWHLGALDAFLDMFLSLGTAGYNRVGLPLEIGSYFLAVLLAAALMPRSDPAGEAEARNQLLVAGMFYGWLHFYLQSRGWGYHAYPFWGFALLMLCYNLPRLTFERSLAQLLCAYGGVAVLLFAFSPAERFAPRRFYNYPPIAAYMKEVEANIRKARGEIPSAIVADPEAAQYPLHFIDFTEAHLWNMAYRFSWPHASRHIYPLPLLLNRDRPYVQSLRQEMLDELSAHRPQLIILSRQSVPFHSKFLWEVIDRDPEFSSLLKRHYRVAVKHPLYWIYARTS